MRSVERVRGSRAGLARDALGQDSTRDRRREERRYNTIISDVIYLVPNIKRKSVQGWCGGGSSRRLFTKNKASTRNPQRASVSLLLFICTAEVVVVITGCATAAQLDKNQVADPTVDRPTRKITRQQINQSINQSTNKSINQPTNRSIKSTHQITDDQLFNQPIGRRQSDNRSIHHFPHNHK